MRCKCCGQGIRREFLDAPFELPYVETPLATLQKQMKNGCLPYEYKPVFWWEMLGKKP